MGTIMVMLREGTALREGRVGEARFAPAAARQRLEKFAADSW
jgi:hypothetical protein